ncbi:unnamed protein product [Brassica oleracea]
MDDADIRFFFPLKCKYHIMKKRFYKEDFNVYDKVLEQLLTSYKQVKIGDPLEKGTLLGPLHTPESRNNFEKGIEVIKSQASTSSPKSSLNLFNFRLKPFCIAGW